MLQLPRYTPRLYRKEQGFALVPVVFMLALLGVFAFVSTREASTGVALTQNIIDRDQSIVTRQAASAHANWLSQSNNCELPADVTGLAFKGGTYDMAFAGSPGNYSITTTTTFSDGSQKVEVQDNLKLFDYANARFVDLAPSADSYIKLETSKMFDNKGDDHDLHISSEANKLERLLFQFDLASIPSNSKITSSDLNIYIRDNEGNQQDFLLHAITTPWSESSVSAGTPWNYAGGDYEAVAAVVFNVAQSGPVITDLTELTQDWVSGKKPNNGVLIRMEATTTKKHMKVESKEDSDASRHPKLGINYVCACGESCEAGIVLDNLGISYGISSEIMGLAFEPEDLVYISRKDSQAEIELDGSNRGFASPIRAAHKLENGRFLLVFENAYTSSGTNFNPEDVAEFDPVNGVFRMVLDGSASGIAEDITAATMSASGRLAIALDKKETVYGTEFEDSDLFYIDPAAGTSEMLFEGDSFGVNKPISSAHLLEDGTVVVGFEQSGTGLGLDFNRGDLVNFDIVSNTVKIYFSGSEFSNENSISALYIGEGQGSISRPTFHFPFGEQIGATATDVVGGRTAGIDDTPGWQPGGLEGSLAFNGSTSKLTIANDSAAELAASFSLMFWAQNTAAQSGDKWLIDKSDATNDAALRVGFVDDQLQWSLEKTGESISIGPLDAIAPDQWHHIALVVDNESDIARTLINGEVVDSTNLGFQPVINSNAWTIGAGWSGVLDELMLVNYPLTAGEVLSQAKQELIAPHASAPPDTGASDSSGSESYNSKTSAGLPDGCSGGVADFFDSKTYTNSNGTVNWPDPWQEYRDDDDPADGKIQIWGSDANKPLLLTDDDRAIYRKLPFAHADELQFSFDVRGTNLDSGEYLRIRVTDNGPSNDWVDLDQINSSTPTTAAEGNRKSYDISQYISDNTYISFHTSNTMGAWDWVSIDNVQIRCLR